jgi:glycosyltransferase involved in cell wall biosynthesis
MGKNQNSARPPGAGKTDAPVSVIIPFYRAENTLRRALQSVLDQSRGVAEILCIDDAAPDKTRAVLAAFIAGLAPAQAEKIRLIPMDRNRGAEAARNAGLDHASQPYVAFLDADDTWLPHKIETQYAAMAADPDLFFTAHRIAVTADGESVPPRAGKTARPRRISRHRALWFSHLPTISVMMKNTQSYRFDAAKRRGGDHLLWLEIILSGEKAAFIETVLACKHKAHFGAGGLSGNLRAAEQEAQHSFGALAARRLISRPYAWVLRIWSFLKFLRRCAVVAGRRLCC